MAANAFLEAVRDGETAMAEFNQTGMTNDAAQKMNKQDEKSMYDRLARECSVRDACGCKTGQFESLEDMIKSRMDAIESFGDRIPNTIKARDGCEREQVTDLLWRRVDATTLQMAAKGDKGASLTTDSVWSELKNVCGDNLPDTLQEFLQPTIER
jgi:hypothetical protein